MGVEMSSETWAPINVVGTRGPEWDIPEFAGRGYDLLDTTLLSLTFQGDISSTTLVLTLEADNKDTCQLAFDGIWDLSLKTDEDLRPVPRVWGLLSSCDTDNVNYYSLRTYALDIDLRSSSQRFRWLSVRP
jgi:hypothetical protein